LASVSVDDVRDVIKVSSAEVPDAKVLKMVKRVEVTLELETSQEIDYSNCSRALRLKECIDCGKRFTTYEYVEAVELMVRRKDCGL
jgi:transcriptional regulator NrdR family protein